MFNLIESSISSEYYIVNLRNAELIIFIYCLHVVHVCIFDISVAFVSCVCMSFASPPPHLSSPHPLPHPYQPVDQSDVEIPSGTSAAPPPPTVKSTSSPPISTTAPPQVTPTGPVPSAPLDLQETDVQAQSITFSWKPPILIPDSLTMYKLYLQPDSDGARYAHQQNLLMCICTQFFFWRY